MKLQITLFLLSLGIFSSSSFAIGLDADSLDIFPELEQDSRFSPNSISDAGLTKTKTLALTFDDGPTGNTRAVLDVLRKYDVPAVFFVNGKNIPGRESIMREIFELGHLIANHTERHANIANTSNPVSAIAQTHEKIRGYIRSGDVLLFRAPFGAWKSSHATILNQNPELSRYVGPIFWNVGGSIHKSGVRSGAADWACWSRGISVVDCTAGYVNESIARQGGIVLFHDVDKRTALMLDAYIRAMKARGFSFVRLDKMSKIRSLQ
jgi:peptidoglycan/xylan/chitin deacetylase (PgdA/CDA1 family)